MFSSFRLYQTQFVNVILDQFHTILCIIWYQKACTALIKWPTPMDIAGNNGHVWIFCIWSVWKKTAYNSNPEMFTNWQLFTDLGEAVKPWALLLASRAERKKWKTRWLTKLTPRLTLWQSRYVSKSNLHDEVASELSGPDHQDPQPGSAGCQLQAASQGDLDKK